MTDHEDAWEVPGRHSDSWLTEELQRLETGPVSHSFRFVSLFLCGLVSSHRSGLTQDWAVYGLMLSVTWPFNERSEHKMSLSSSILQDTDIDKAKLPAPRGFD